MRLICVALLKTIVSRIGGRSRETVSLGIGLLMQKQACHYNIVHSSNAVLVMVSFTVNACIVRRCIVKDSHQSSISYL